jgi:hypothetical protein
MGGCVFEGFSGFMAEAVMKSPVKVKLGDEARIAPSGRGANKRIC